jgi:hypothetical protein
MTTTVRVAHLHPGDKLMDGRGRVIAQVGPPRVERIGGRRRVCFIRFEGELEGRYWNAATTIKVERAAPPDATQEELAAARAHPRVPRETAGTEPSRNRWTPGGWTGD